MTNKEEIDQLRSEIERLKAAQPTTYDDAAAARWKNEMHQLREKRASGHIPFTRSQLEAMDAACSAADIKDLVSHGTIPSRSAAGSSGQLGKVSSGAGIPGSNTSSWIAPTPLSNPPGIAYVDMLCEVDAAKQRGERMVAEARRKVAEEKPK